MSDVSPESAWTRDAASPAPDSNPAPDSHLAEPWFAPPTDARTATPDPGAVQRSASPATGGFGAPDPGALQQWPSSPPALGYPWPDPRASQSAPQRPSRRMRGPLIGFVAGAVVVAVGGGGYLLAHNLSANRNNTPVATSSQAKSGGITVAGHGIKMTFPVGWVNAPTSPNRFRQFMKTFEDKYGHVPANMRSEVVSPQLISSFAMLVYHFKGQGNFAENLNALVAPSEVPPSQMMAQLKSGQGPAQFGATNVHYGETTFGPYRGVLVTYNLHVEGMTAYGAQSYLDGPGNMVVTTVTSQSAATSETDLRRIVDTIRFT